MCGLATHNVFESRGDLKLGILLVKTEEYGDGLMIHRVSNYGPSSLWIFLVS